MKEIVMIFKTKKGEKAYHEVVAMGKKQNFMERKITNAVASDSIISKNPLTVKIKIKTERLAVQVKLDEQIITALAKKGAKKSVDYDIMIS